VIIDAGVSGTGWHRSVCTELAVSGVMRAVLLSSLVLLSACGGSVVSESTPDAATEAGADVAIGPPVDTGGVPTPTDAGPATPACVKTNDHIEIALAGEGRSFGCGVVGSEKTGLTGAIVSVDTSLVKVDTCHPAADCIPSIVTVTAKAPGLDLRSMKKGSFVEVFAAFGPAFPCTPMLTIRSVATWGGMKNPVDGEKTYLVAAEGRYGSAYPFNVDLVKTGCMSGMSCSTLEVDWYKLRFIAVGGGPPATLGMGETGSFWAGGQTFVARNLRSFNEGACDAFDFAWYATSF